MTVIRAQAGAWRVGAAELVGDLPGLLARLRARADDGAVAFGIDCPLGLPRAYAALHAREPDFPAFLRHLPQHGGFYEVAAQLQEVAPARPFYPARSQAGMTRLSHASALGLADAAALNRACDRATSLRPAGAPLFWTLGANQTGHAAISAWRDLLVPALNGPSPPRLWPFEGRYRQLLAPGHVAIAETYPAEARHLLGLAPGGSKRRQTDRAAHAAALEHAMQASGVEPDNAARAAIQDGFGSDAAGEDRFDSLLGALCVLAVVQGHLTDEAPADPWITRWEGWVLGQNAEGIV